MLAEKYEFQEEYHITVTEVLILMFISDVKFCKCTRLILRN